MGANRENTEYHVSLRKSDPVDWQELFKESCQLAKENNDFDTELRNAIFIAMSKTLKNYTL